VEQVHLSTHNGTHLDAPWHFHPTMNRGERSWTIDEVPLEWCLQPGVKLDFRHLPDGHVATPKDVENELKRIGHTLSPLEIVVVNTSAGAKYGRPDYVNSAAAWDMRQRCIYSKRGVRLTRHRWLELGTRRSSSRRRNMPKPKTPADLGKANRAGRAHRLLPHRKVAQP